MTPSKDYASHLAKSLYAFAQKSAMLTISIQVSVQVSALGVTFINTIYKHRNIGACTIMHEQHSNGLLAIRTISAHLGYHSKTTWKCPETLQRKTDLASDLKSFAWFCVRAKIQIPKICLVLIRTKCMALPSLCIVIFTNHKTVYRVSWLKAKARYQRWAEEIRLGEIKMNGLPIGSEIKNCVGGKGQIVYKMRKGKRDFNVIVINRWPCGEHLEMTQSSGSVDYGSPSK